MGFSMRLWKSIGKWSRFLAICGFVFDMHLDVFQCTFKSLCASEWCFCLSYFFFWFNFSRSRQHCCRQSMSHSVSGRVDVEGALDSGDGRADWLYSTEYASTHISGRLSRIWWQQVAFSARGLTTCRVLGEKCFPFSFFMGIFVFGTWVSHSGTSHTEFASHYWNARWLLSLFLGSQNCPDWSLFARYRARLFLHLFVVWLQFACAAINSAI